MRIFGFIVSVFLSLLGLVMMFSLSRNRYAWMSEFSEQSMQVPIDPNSAIKTGMVLVLGAGVVALNVWIIRQRFGRPHSSLAAALLLGVALALWRFFTG